MLFPTFRWFGENADVPPGERMVREHSSWLSRMLGLAGRGKGPQPPRIPVRKVSEGGFSRLMSTPGGRYRAERWWERTLEKLKD